jgi:hypothetical protein
MSKLVLLTIYIKGKLIGPVLKISHTKSRLLKSSHNYPMLPLPENFFVAAELNFKFKLSREYLVGERTGREKNAMTRPLKLQTYMEFALICFSFCQWEGALDYGILK